MVDKNKGNIQLHDLGIPEDIHTPVHYARVHTKYAS